MGDISSYAPKILKYARDLEMKPTMDLMKAGQPLGPLMGAATSSFAQPIDAETGYFAEGALIMQVLNDGVSDFSHFIQDATKGCTAMGNAACVVADTYAKTDASSADDMSLIDFAFQMPGAHRPDGIPTKLIGNKTLDQLAKEQQKKQPDAVSMPIGKATAIYPAAGVTTYIFPDGSTKTVTVTSSANGTKSTTTYSGTNGKPVGPQETTTTERHDGYTTTTRSEGKGSRTVTKQYDDGRTEVTTHQKIDGKDHHETVKYNKPSGSTDSSGDPLKKAENDYDSQGSPNGESRLNMSRKYAGQTGY